MDIIDSAFSVWLVEVAPFPESLTTLHLSIHVLAMDCSDAAEIAILYFSEDIDCSAWSQLSIPINPYVVKVERVIMHLIKREYAPN